MSDKLGATGKFPQGKAGQHDEGELRMAIATSPDGIIRMEFGKSVSWIGFGPGEARQLAKLLIEHADALEN